MANPRAISMMSVDETTAVAAMSVRRFSLNQKHFSGFCGAWAVLGEAAVMSGRISQFVNYFQMLNQYAYSDLRFFHVPTQEAANTIDDFSKKAQIISQWFLRKAMFVDGGRDRFQRRKQFRQIAALEDTPAGGQTVEVVQLFAVYSQSNLRSYVQGLRSLVENNEQIKYPVCFLLYTPGHEVLFGYSPESRQWYIVNSGQFLQINITVNTSVIANLIQQAFENMQQIAMTTTVSTGENQLAILKFALAQLTQQSPWRELHAAKTQANRIDDAGVNALHLAALDSHAELVAELIQQGAVASQKKIDDGQSVLHFAIAGGSRSIVEQILLSDHSMIDMQDKYGRTPLYYAAVRGDSVLTQLLLANHADIYLAENNGITPLEIAKKENHQAVVDLLSQCYNQGRQDHDRSPTSMPEGSQSVNAVCRLAM